MARERLPARRVAETIEIEHATNNGPTRVLAITVGRYDDGRVGEVFVEVPYQQQKFATALLGRDVATLISIALQHGASVEELRDAMGHSEVNRMGNLVDLPHTIVGTVLTALAREAH